MEDLRTEKGSVTASVAMTGGDVARQMAQTKAKIDSEVMPYDRSVFVMFI